MLETPHIDGVAGAGIMTYAVKYMTMVQRQRLRLEYPNPTPCFSFSFHTCSSPQTSLGGGLARELRLLHLVDYTARAQFRGLFAV